MSSMHHTTLPRIQITSSRVLLDGALVPAVVTVDSGRVIAIESGRAVAGSPPRVVGREIDPGARLIDLGDNPVCPPPVDLHLHGAGGVAVPPSGGVGDLDAAIARICEQEGWVHPASGGPDLPVPYSYLATLPAPARTVVDVVDHVAAAARAIAAAGRTRCVGLRIEGVFLNPSKAGVWPPETFRAPDVELLRQMIDAAAGQGVPLRILDVAPELPGAIELIEVACEQGVIVSLAHTDATFEQAHRGIEAGATMATHTFNAMRPLHHREPGVLGAVLSDDRVTCELVCDGVHVHPAVLGIAAAAKGRGGFVAVSDASPFAGCADGAHFWEGMRINVVGRELRDDAGNLAGAASLLTRASRVLAASGVLLTERLVAISAQPLRVLDPSRTLGLVVGDQPWLVGDGSLPPQPAGAGARRSTLVSGR